MFSVALQTSRRSPFLLVLLLSMLGSGSPLSGQAPSAAAPRETPTSSLDLVPADSAFYFSTSSHKQIWQAITESRAYAALTGTPAGRKMRKAYRKGLSRGWEQFGENPLRYYLEGYANSLDSVEGKMILPYVERLFGEEVFVYADGKTVAFLNALNAYYDELNVQLSDSSAVEDSAETWDLIERVGEKHLAKLEVPTIVLGAIADEPEVFIGFLELMQTGMQQVIAQDPVSLEILAKAVRYHNEGKTTAERVAWFGIEIVSDELPWEELSQLDPDIASVLDAIKPLYANKRFVIAFAVKGRAVLLTCGPSFEHIRQLGNGPLLIDQPLLEPLRKVRSNSHPICLASFQSAEFARLSQSTWSDLAQGATNLMSRVLNSLESELLSVDELQDLTSAFEVEAQQFANEMEAFETTPGATLSFAQMTPAGIEGFVYQFDQPAENTTTRPLLLTSQLSTPPLLAVFTRDQSTAEQWRILNKYLGKLFAGLEEYGPLMAEDLEQAEISAIVLEQVAPLLQRLSEATFGQLLPQMAGEEWGLIVDLSIARSSWHAAMPPASAPLPLPGAVLLMSLKDSAAMQEVGSQYLAIARQALEDIKELGGGDVPESLEIPDPQATSLAQGMQYSFPLPADLGLSADWLPHATLSDKLLAIGYFPEQTARLPPDEETAASNRSTQANRLFGPAAEQGANIGLFLLDNQQLTNAIEAWVDYGIEQAEAQGLPNGLETPAETPDLNLNKEEVRETLRAIFNFYRCFHGASARTYTEGNQRVQHFLLQFRDLDR